MVVVARRKGRPSDKMHEQALADVTGTMVGGRVFQQWEGPLKAAIKQAQAPFLGLLGGLMPAAARSAIARDVSVTPGAWSFAQRLEQFPALFAVWLAEHVMNGLGQHGYYEVYPFVQRAVGASSPLSQNDKERLWASFRRALVKLGLEPVPRDAPNSYRLTGEYVRQAGVPIAFADDLAERMLRHARRVGLPDEHDHSGLQAWQASLVDRLQLPFSQTARDAVSRDFQAYYAHAFARLVGNGGAPEAGNALEEAFVRAFATAQGGPALRRSAPPQLLYRDGFLGLQVPSGQAGTYRVRWGAEEQQIRVGDEGAFYSLPTTSAHELVVEDSAGQQILRRTVWSDNLSNRLLVFSDAGRLVAQAQLRAESVTANEIELPPGRYVALCRFEPDGIQNAQELCDAPKLVEVLLDIRPGGRQRLAYGAAAVALIGQERPSLAVEGPRKTSLERLDIHYGALLALVDLPAEGFDEGDLELRVRVQSTERLATQSLRPAAGGQPLEVPLPPLFAHLNLTPGLQRITLEIGRKGEVRAYQRLMLWYWAGLNRINSDLELVWKERPRNLRGQLCRGLSIGDTGARPSDDLQRGVRLCFESSPGRLAHFTWNRPGTFIEIELTSADGTITRTGRPLGSSESVSSVQRKTVIVSCSGSGTLRLGQWSLPIDFDRTPSKSLAAGFLAGKLEPGSATLEFKPDGASLAEELLHLCQPHVVDRFSAQKLGNAIDLKLRVRGEVRSFRLNATSLHTGERREQECSIAPGMTQHGPIATVQVQAVPEDGATLLHCLLDARTVAPGTWMFTFEADVDGIVGRLEDDTQGRVGTCLSVTSTGQEIPPFALSKDIESLSEGQLLTALREVGRYFQVYWSPLCGDRLGWLGGYWNSLMQVAKADPPKYLTTLIDLCCLEPDPDGRAGWQPKQHVGGQLPQVFTLKRIEYRKVNNRRELLARTLRALGDVRAALSDAFGPVISGPVACAFDNAAKIEAGQWPSGFSLLRYVGVLAAVPVEDSYRLEDGTAELRAGEFLGTLHLTLGWHDLERRFGVSSQFETNRRARALTIARMLAQRQQLLPDMPATPVASKNPVILLGSTPLDGLPDGLAQYHENLRSIAHACSLLAWHCRMASRIPEALEEFLSRLDSYRQPIGMHESIDGCVSFYVQTAPVLFGYYLMLWEIVQASALDKQVIHA